MATYTDPELRQRLKEEITQGDKGGKPGQWSARKAQLLAHEYEKAGGGYSGPKDGRQKHLEDWSKEDWQTADGKKEARSRAGTDRYLPKEAWDQLSDEEKNATRKAKQDADEQHVPNTEAAKDARKGASHPIPGYDDLTAKDLLTKLSDLSPAKLKAVKEYEQAHKARKTVLDRVEKLL